MKDALRPWRGIGKSRTVSIASQAWWFRVSGSWRNVHHLHFHGIGMHRICVSDTVSHPGPLHWTPLSNWSGLVGTREMSFKEDESRSQLNGKLRREWTGTSVRQLVGTHSSGTPSLYTMRLLKRAKIQGKSLEKCVSWWQTINTKEPKRHALGTQSPSQTSRKTAGI